MKNKIELNTVRLILRPAKSKDAKTMFKYLSDLNTNKYQGWLPKTIEDVNDFLRTISKKINLVNTWFLFVIIDKVSAEIIGDVGIRFLHDEQVEIRCTLKKQKQGKGYASEALKATINYLFNKLNKHRIIASIDYRNSKSIKLIDRLGFKKEGCFKESLFINGEWIDDIIYAMLKKEWKNKQINY